MVNTFRRKVETAMEHTYTERQKFFLKAYRTVKGLTENDRKSFLEKLNVAMQGKDDAVRNLTEMFIDLFD